MRDPFITDIQSTISRNHIDIHLVLTSSFDDASCFYKIDNLGDRFFVHHARLYDKADITDELKKYMAIACDVGNREHVTTRKKK